MNNHRYSSFFNNHSQIIFLMFWMTITPWLSTAAFTYLAIENETWIRNFSVISWFFFFMTSSFTMGLAITPTTFISLLCGYFLGLKAIVPIILSYQLASLIGFSLANKMDHQTLEWVQQKFPQVRGIFLNVKRQQWLTTFLARISPALPFGLMNVVLSLSGIRFIPFFFGGLIGMLPRTLFFIWLGIQAPILIEALQTDDHLIWFVLLSLAGIFALFKILSVKR